MLGCALVALACLLQAPAEQPEKRPPFTMGGKKMTAANVRLASKPFVPKLIANPTPVAVGKLAKIEGVWAGFEDANDPDSLGVVVIPAKVVAREPEKVRLSLEHLPEFSLRKDVKVTVYGAIHQDGYVEAWLVDVAPPGLQWAAQLRNPGAVIAGQEQTYTVDVVIKNTGQQTFSSVTGAVRLWQRESPNDTIEKIVVNNLQPGETRTVAVPITFFNFQVIGKTSVPQCAFSVTDFE